MTLHVRTAAVRIRRDLRAAEAQADAALLANAKLLESMLLARALPEAEVHTGQKAIIRLARAIQEQVNASSDLFRVHDAMSEVGRETGIYDEPTPRSELTEQDVLKAA